MQMEKENCKARIRKLDIDNKDSWNLPVTSHQKEIQMERTNVQTPRERKGSEMNWEIGVDFYTKCYIQSSQMMRTYYRVQRTIQCSTVT